MKKPLKVLSSTALAAALMSSSLVPVAVMAAEDQQQVSLDAVVLENEGKLYTAELGNYIEAATEQFSMNAKYVQVGDKYFTVEDFIEAQVEAGSLDETAKLLQGSYKPVSLDIAGQFIAENGNWIYQDEQPSEVNKDALNEAIAEAKKPETTEGKTEDSVEALNKAIAEAEKVADKKDATTEEVEAAIKALEEAVEGLVDAEEPAEDKIAVAKVEAVNKSNHKAVTVTFPEDSEVTAEDLEGKTITLKADDKTITATFAHLEDGAATFTASEDLVDATEYAVEADWAKFDDATFTAKLAEAYVAEIMTDTKAISKESNKIVLKGLDQYGEEIPLTEQPTVKTPDTTIHGVPAKDDQLTVTNSEVKFKQVNDADLAKEGTLHLVLEYAVGTGDDKVTKQLVKDIEIQAGKDIKAPEATEITKLNAETVATEDQESKEIKDFVDAEATVKVTPEVIDQYGNAITVAENDLRWAITKGADLIEVTAPKNAGNVFNAKEITYKALAPGEVVIDVFLPNGDKQTHKVTIGEVAINEITFDVKTELATAELVNHKEIDLGTLSANQGAELKAEDIKFDVTKKVDGKNVKVELPSEEIEVTAVANEVEEGKDATYTIKATTKAAGEYTVTPYVDGDKDKIKSEGSATFTTKVESTVKEATIADFNTEANTLKVKKQGENLVKVKKEIVFKNQYGEVVEPEAKDGKVTTNVTINSSNPDILKVGDITVEEVKEGDKVVGKKYFVTVTPKTEGKAVLTLQGTGKPVVYPFDIEDAVLDKVTVEKSSIGEMIAGDKVAEYNKVALLDQDGDNMPVENLTFKVTNAKGEEVTADKVKVESVKAYYDEKDEKFVELNAGETNEKAENMLKVTVEEEASAGKHTIKVIAQEESKEADKELKEVATTFTVDVKAKRAPETIEVVPVSSSASLNTPSTYKVVVKDQYGEAFDLSSADLLKVTELDEEGKPVTEGEEVVTLGDVEHVETELDEEGNVLKGLYTFTAKSAKEGTFNLAVTIGEGDDQIKEPVTFTVGQGSDLVHEIAVTGEGVKDGKAIHKVAAEKNEAMTGLSISAKTENGEGVVLSDDDLKDLFWNSNNPEVAKVVNGNLVTGEVDKDTEVTLTANYHGKEATLTVIVSKEDSRAVNDTVKVFLGEDEDAQEINLEKGIVLGENAVDGQVTLTFTAADQYGEAMEGFLPEVVLSKDAKYATVAKDTENKKVVVTAQGVTPENVTGTIEVRAYTDTPTADIINIPFTVKEEAVTAKKAAEAANKALKDAVGKIPTDLEEADKYTEDSVQAVKDAQKLPQETTEQKNTEAQAINEAVEGLKTQEQAAEEKANEALTQAKKSLEGKTAKDYTTETWEKVTEAQKMPETTTEEKNHKAEAINAAVEGLVLQADADKAQAKQELSDDITKATKTAEEYAKYTKTSVEAYKAAIQVAQGVLNADESDQKAYENAKQALATAIAGDAKLEAKTDAKAVEFGVGKVADEANPKSITFTVPEGTTLKSAEGTGVTLSEGKVTVAAGEDAELSTLENIEVTVTVAATDDTKETLFTYTLTFNEGKWTLVKKGA